jgi:hypothetical protein
MKIIKFSGNVLLNQKEVSVNRVVEPNDVLDCRGGSVTLSDNTELTNVCVRLVDAGLDWSANALYDEPKTEAKAEPKVESAKVSATKTK